ncbi:MAG: ATP-binding protein, partial [archaeon]|nr:ATP-binding protein [archaeon]
MLIGEVYGKTGTKKFRFYAYKEIKKQDFVTVKDEENHWILCKVDIVESISEDRKNIKNMALAEVIGYREDGILKSLKKPIRPNSLVYSADRKVIQETLRLERGGLYVGVLDSNKDVEVFLDPKSLVTKHVAVLASTGAGKSYTVSVILEELLDKKIPIVVLDPHGEYISLRFANDEKRELALMNQYKIKPKAYKVVEYSPDPRVNPGSEQLTFSDQNLGAVELSQITPSNTTASQKGLLFTAIRELKDRGDYRLKDIINKIDQTESAAKWNLLNMLEFVKDMGLFSDSPTHIDDMIAPGQATVVNFRGIPPEIQGIVAYKLVHDIFEMRKVGRVPPLFLILEEAHNFCPEKEVIVSSKIIRTVASEGRKFGLGLCIISQRPARVDKNILSQCNTQIIMKITNPNDLKAVSYAEGMTEGVEKEITNLNPGTALILGQGQPIFVDIRIRKTKHGGVTISITEQPKTGKKILSFSTIPRQNLESRLGSLKVLYYPCYHVAADAKSYLFEGMQGNVIYNDKSVIKQQELDFSSAELELMNLLSTEMDTDTILEKSTLSFGELVSVLDSMIEKDLVKKSSDAGGIDLYSLKGELTIHPFRERPVYVVIDGDLLKPKITMAQMSEKAKSIFT